MRVQASTIASVLPDPLKGFCFLSLCYRSQAFCI